MLGTRVPKLLRAGLWALLAAGGFAFGFTAADAWMRPYRSTARRTLFYRPGLAVHVEYKPEDLWLGLFWRSTVHRVCYRGRYFGERIARLDFYLCLVPCVPLHVTWWPDP